MEGTISFLWVQSFIRSNTYSFDDVSVSFSVDPMGAGLGLFDTSITTRIMIIMISIHIILVYIEINPDNPNKNPMMSPRLNGRRPYPHFFPACDIRIHTATVSMISPIRIIFNPFPNLYKQLVLLILAFINRFSIKSIREN